MRTLPSRDDSAPQIIPNPGATGKSATWLNRAVERGWHLLTAKLRTKLLVTFLGVSLCPLAVISYRDSEVTRSALTASAYQALFAAASQTALRLDTFIAATSNVIGTQAQMPPLGEYLSLAAADQGPAERRTVDILQAFAQKNPAFTSSVAVLDLHGRIVLDTRPSNVGLDESATEYFRMALETGLPHASRLEFSSSDGKPYLNFSSVVHSPDGKPVGVLRERYSAAVLQQMVAENNRLVGPQSFAMVLDEDGLLLADGHLSPGQLSDGLFKSTRPLDPARVAELRTRRLLPSEFAQHLSLNFPGLAEGVAKAGWPAPYFTLQLSNDGSPQHAAAVTRMKTQPWMVVFLQPQDVFLAPIRAQTRQTVLLALGIVGAVAAAAIGVAQLLTVPIVGLMAVARQVAEGNFEGRVLVRSRDEIGALATAFNFMTERLKATLEGLRRSEEDYRGTYENALEGIWRVSPDGRVLSANPAMARMLGYSSPDELVASVCDIGRQLYVRPQERNALLSAHAEGAAIVGRELEFYHKDGQRIWVLASARPIHDEGGHLLFVEGFVADITRRKRAEEERQAHLWFLESLDQVNRAIQGTHDLEPMMSEVLDAVLATFHGDRAWLVYPCDPEAASWHVPMEQARPAFPGAFALGLELPVDPDVAHVFHTVRASSGPVRFGPGAEHPLPAEAAQRFRIQSMMAMAIYPKGDQPYLFGLHQCSYPRVWTPQEERLFQEIGRRLEDALTSLLMLRSLRESEAKLEEAQRLTHVGYWDHDRGADRLTWSDETYRIFGLPPQERIVTLTQWHEQWTELIHPDDQQIMVQAVAEALRGGPRYDVEYRVVRPDGEVRIVHSRGDVMRDGSGRPRRMFGTVQDITDRKRAEEELQRQKAQLDELFELSPDAIVLTTLNNPQNLRINKEFTRMFGYTSEEAVGRRLRHLIAPADLRPADLTKNPDLLAGRTVEREVIRQRKDGTRFHAHITAKRVRLRGDEDAAYIIYRDITERKRAELRLMTQHTVTQMLAEAATLEDVTPKILRAVCEFLLWDLGALWNLDRETGVLRCVEVWHKASVEVSQFEAISRASTFPSGIGLPGHVWSSREPAYIPDVVQDANFPRAHIAAREGLHAAFGFPILLGSDVLGVMEFFSHEIRQPDRDLLNMMATIGSQIGQFIERKRAEEALRHAQVELAHMTRVATLGELTASIAHEINQPLGAVVNNASACVRWLAAQNLEEARQSAALVIEDGHRAAEIIRRIRNLAQKAPPQKDWLDINATIRDVIALARSELHAHRVSLQTHLAGDIPLILGDRVQVQQVLLNLMMNAIEAMSGVGAGPRELWVSSKPLAATEVLIAVGDSGPGLDPQSLNRLFDAFYTTKPHGLGMGLAISRSIVAAHGGRLWATANTPHGAVFQFTLPMGREGVA
jgi:PAS domain S-box-containing protein